MKDERIGNDINVIWSILQAEEQPLNLERYNCTLYLKNSFGKTKVNDFMIEGNVIRWTFKGKDQKNLGKHSLTLVLNEGMDDMHTTDACNLVNLVPCSCQVGGSDDDGIKTETIELTSTLEYVAGWGGDITIDTELSETSQNAIANATVTAELAKVGEELKKKLSVDVVIAPTNDAQVLMSAFKTYDLANKLNVPMQCLIKKERSDEDYMLATLIVEDYRSVNAGYRLTFTMYGNKTNAISGGKIDEQSVYSPDAQSADNILSYLYNEQYGYVIPLGVGNTAFPELENKVKEMLKGKVDVEKGKGLSSNDFTDTDKKKLDGLQNYDDSDLRDEIAGLGNTQNLYAYPSFSDFDGAPRKVINLGGDRLYYELGEITPDKPNGTINGPAITECYYQYKKDGKYLAYDSRFIPYASLYIGNEEEQYATLKITIPNQGEDLEYIRFATPPNSSAPMMVELAVDWYGVVHYRNYMHAANKSLKVYCLFKVYELDEAFIPSTIARKDELTELSERIDELGEGGSLVFEAIPEETPYEDILAAYEANKYVICKRHNYTYSLVRMYNNNAHFSCISDGSVNTMTCDSLNRWVYTSYSVEKTTNKVTSISNASTNNQYPSAKAVYDFVQSQGGGGSGMTTPSGDPMHYAYVEAGAEYNDTGADITRTGEYGDTIVWKAGYWWLNELGDITNDQMRAIFVHWQKILQSHCYYGAKLRTNLPFKTSDTSTSSDTRDILSSFAQQSYFEVFDWRVTAPIYAPKRVWGNNFIYCYKLKKILGEISATTVIEISNNTFDCSTLEEIRIKGLKVKVSFFPCSKLSYASINYLISNSAATATITLTLHATALANAEAAYLEDITQDLSTYPTLSDWALSKNIQIATA